MRRAVCWACAVVDVGCAFYCAMRGDTAGVVFCGLVFAGSVAAATWVAP